MDQTEKTNRAATRPPEAVTTNKAIFNSLRGQWQLSRALQSSLPTYPSGKLIGNANLDEMPFTDTQSDDNEYLYSEEGHFVTEKGLSMKASRQYVYRYQRETDSLSVWFVKGDSASNVPVVDYLFYYLDFKDAGDEFGSGDTAGTDGAVVVSATGHHLCVNDIYDVEYSFTFLGHILMEWTVEYTVKGPQKDYVASARYTRALSAEGLG